MGSEPLALTRSASSFSWAQMGLMAIVLRLACEITPCALLKDKLHICPKRERITQANALA